MNYRNFAAPRHDRRVLWLPICWAIGVACAVGVTTCTCRAVTITIDKDTLIDAASSFPEPPIGQPELFVEIKSGLAGPPIVQLVEGGVIGGFVNVGDQSHLMITGGQIEALTRVTDESTLTLSGGRIAPLIRFYASADVIGVLEAEDSSTVNLKGGDVFGTIFQHDSSIVNVFGYGFDVAGELPTSSESISTVRLTGFYPNGSALDIEIIRLSADAKVFLHVVPEPSCAILSVLAIASLSRYARRDLIISAR